jgi:hypothetical protein
LRQHAVEARQGSSEALFEGAHKALGIKGLAEFLAMQKAMKAHEQRFFALEHLTSMLLAIALAHASPSVTATRS